MKFKVKYDHQVGTRSGVRIIEVLPPEGTIAAMFTSLNAAQYFYVDVQHQLDALIDG